MPTLPAMYAFPVVVAPPKMVSPPPCAPLPMVEEAEEMSPLVRLRSEEKVLDPLKRLLSARSVEDAALSVMFAVPLKETPLIVRAFWRAVAVPALPETAPVMV